MFMSVSCVWFLSIGCCWCLSRKKNHPNPMCVTPRRLRLGSFSVFTHSLAVVVVVCLVVSHGVGFLKLRKFVMGWVCLALVFLSSSSPPRRLDTAAVLKKFYTYDATIIPKKMLAPCPSGAARRPCSPSPELFIPRPSIHRPLPSLLPGSHRSHPRIQKAFTWYQIAISTPLITIHVNVYCCCRS